MLLDDKVNKLLYCIVLYCCRLWADIKTTGRGSFLVAELVSCLVSHFSF